MKRLLLFIGVLGFWLAWPILFVYLRNSQRTRVLVVSGSQALVVRNWLSAGTWSLPGGGLQRHEDPRQGAVRELREEVGMDIQPSQLIELGVFDSRQHGFKFRYHQFFIEVPKPELFKRRPSEVAEVKWLPISSLNRRNTSSNALKTLRQWQDLP